MEMNDTECTMSTSTRPQSISVLPADSAAISRTITMNRRHCNRWKSATAHQWTMAPESMVRRWKTLIYSAGRGNTTFGMMTARIIRMTASGWTTTSVVIKVISSGVLPAIRGSKIQSTVNVPLLGHSKHDVVRRSAINAMNCRVTAKWMFVSCRRRTEWVTARWWRAMSTRPSWRHWLSCAPFPELRTPSLRLSWSSISMWAVGGMMRKIAP